MTGLVLELQRDALGNGVSVTDLLRKALVISRKLNVLEIQQWITSELNGYTVEDRLIPDYRLVVGTPMVKHPLRGWTQINFDSTKTANIFSAVKNSQSVSELDAILSRNDDSPLLIDYPSELVAHLVKQMRQPMQPQLVVQSTAVVAILNAVRNQILEWSLELEAQGVLGDGMSFSEKEKSVASSVTYNVTNNIGAMHNSQLQQDSPHATQSLQVSLDSSQLNSFLTSLKNQIDDLKLDYQRVAELGAEITTIETQLSSPKPKRSIVVECLNSVRAILENAAGNLVATGLIAELNALF